MLTGEMNALEAWLEHLESSSASQPILEEIPTIPGSPAPARQEAAARLCLRAQSGKASMPSPERVALLWPDQQGQH
jgi:anti-sigma factor ChrR (cupin superfamily)